jgi:hypothetical protein
MIVDDYGLEWNREFGMTDSAELISQMGLRAFLTTVAEYIEDDIEAENIQKVLEQW